MSNPVNDSSPATPADQSPPSSSTSNTRSKGARGVRAAAAASRSPPPAVATTTQSKPTSEKSQPPPPRKSPRALTASDAVKTTTTTTTTTASATFTTTPSKGTSVRTKRPQPAAATSTASPQVGPETPSPPATATATTTNAGSARAARVPRPSRGAVADGVSSPAGNVLLVQQQDMILPGTRNAEFKVAELQAFVQRLSEDLRSQKIADKKKSTEMDKLRKEVEDKAELEHSLCQAQNMLKLRDREIKDLLDELKFLKSVADQQSKAKPATSASGKAKAVELDEEVSAVIKTLEGDKRFLKFEIDKWKETVALQERTIRAQQARIVQFETRMAYMTTALKDLKLEKLIPAMPKASGDPQADGVSTSSPRPPVDPAAAAAATSTQETATSSPNHESDPTAKAAVDSASEAQYVQLLQRDLDRLRGVVAQKDLLLLERDVAVEALDRKVEILVHAQRTGARVSSMEKKELNSYVDDLRQALEIQQETYRKEIEKLKAELSRAKQQPAI